MRHRQPIVLLAVLLLFVSASAYAQVTTATLVGLVRDNAAAVIPGATVTAGHHPGIARDARHTATKVFAPAKTNFLDARVAKNMDVKVNVVLYRYLKLI